MRQIVSLVKIVFLFLVVGATSILGFFGIGKSDESTTVFSGLDFGNNIAHADHVTSSTSGTQCSSTGGGGDHADCSTGCADGADDGGDSGGCSCGNSGNADSDSGNSGAGDGSSN